MTDPEEQAAYERWVDSVLGPDFVMGRDGCCHDCEGVSEEDYFEWLTIKKISDHCAEER